MATTGTRHLRPRTSFLRQVLQGRGHETFATRLQMSISY
jgi:hypothetical protein